MLLRWEVSTLLVWTWLAAVPSMAARIMFTDCLSAPPPNGLPYFKPTGATAVFQNEQHSSNNTMAVTVYGEAVNGELIDLNTATNKYTTLKVNVDMLQYSQVDRYERFCQFVNNGTCPFVNGSFTVSYGLTDSFQGVSVDNQFTIIDTSTPGIIIGCVEIEVTPILAHYVWYILVFVILGVFLAFCAIYMISNFWNPWARTRDVFLSTSIYRQDVNSIRLITPGTFDLIKYLQHAVLVTGGLNLAYPGFLPPIVSSAAWSCLLFAVNFATKRNSQLQDNIYAIFGRFGLSRLAKVIKLDADNDIWPSFIIWLVIVVFAVILLSFVVVIVSWAIKNKITSLRESIKENGLHFVGGNIIRLLYNVFAVPFVTFCFFQLLIIKREHSSIAADFFAGLLLLLWLLGAIFLGFKVWNMPQDTKYHDLKSKLLYGPLYNTYTENRSAFCLIDLAIAFFKGVTIGAIQDSGLAQITILATIEVCYLFALWTLRPYASKTNMNVTQSIVTCVRLITTFLLIAFVASMNTNAAVKGWIGYAILLIHALVILIAAIHCIQVLIEVIARLNGAGMNTRPELTIDTGYHAKLSSRVHPSDSTPYGDGTKTPDGLLSNQSAIGYSKGAKGTKRGSVPNYHQRSDSFLRKSSLGDGRRRESVFEDVFVASPTSETSPISGNPAKSGYYRAPRHRRQSSHDWAYGVPGKERVPQDSSGKASAAASVYEGEDDFTFVKRAQTDMTSVDYAVRESDLYYTQRQPHQHSMSVASEHDYVSDYEEYDDFKKRNSGNALLEEIAASSRSPYNDMNNEPSPLHTTSEAAAPQSSKWHFIHKLKDSIGKRRTSITPLDNIEPTGSGFQVMRRAPIKAYKALPRGPDNRTSSDMELNTFSGKEIRGGDTMRLVRDDNDDDNEDPAVVERAHQLDDTSSSSDNFLECIPPSSFTAPSSSSNNKKNLAVATPDDEFFDGMAQAPARNLRAEHSNQQHFSFESPENTM